MIKRKLKSLFDGIMSVQNDRAHNAQAQLALKNIESYKGKTPLAYIKQCDEYAIKVLGSKKYAPWLYVYSAAGFHGFVLGPFSKVIIGSVEIIKEGEGIATIGSGGNRRIATFHGEIEVGKAKVAVHLHPEYST